MIEREAWYREASDPVTQAILTVRQRYLDEGEVECLYDIGSGLCDTFAMDVIQELGGYQSSPVTEYGLDNFALPGEDGHADPPYAYDLDVFAQFGITSPPEGWTWEELGEVDLSGHVFLGPSKPPGKFYDAEAPEGVSTPFDLPFFQRYLREHRKPGSSEDNEWQRARQKSLEERG